MVYFSEGLRLRVGGDLVYDLGLWPSALEPCMAYFSEGLRLRAGGLCLESLLLSVEICFTI